MQKGRGGGRRPAALRGEGGLGVPRGSGRTGVPSRAGVASGQGEGSPSWLRSGLCDSLGVPRGRNPNFATRFWRQGSRACGPVRRVPAVILIERLVLPKKESQSPDSSHPPQHNVAKSRSRPPACPITRLVPRCAAYGSSSRCCTRETITSFSAGADRATSSVVAARVLGANRRSPDPSAPLRSRKYTKRAAAQRLLPS